MQKVLIKMVTIIVNTTMIDIMDIIVKALTEKVMIKTVLTYMGIGEKNLHMK